LRWPFYVIDRSGFLVAETFDDLRSRAKLCLPDGRAALPVLFADRSDFCVVELGVAVGEERAHGYPLRPHTDGEYVIVLVCDGHRPPADEVDVLLAVPVDEFRVADVLPGEGMRVLLGDPDGHPDAISLPFLGVVDGESEPLG